MPSWVVVLIVIVVVGVAVIAYGYFHDRAINRRRREEMLNPPDRIIPGFADQGPTPTYLSGRQAHVPPGPAPALTTEERAALAKARADAEPLRVGYADRDFVNDVDEGLVVLTEPVVLVCAEPVGTIRELLPVIDLARKREAPLVVVAPEMDVAVLETLVVNRIQRLLRVVAVVTPDMALLFAIAERTGATVIDHSDLQAGYVPDQHLGRCAAWVSAANRTWVATPSAHPTGPPGAAEHGG